MTKAEYENDRRIYKEYLAMKDRHDDMHGVSDAANDIRELDAKWKGVVEGRGLPPDFKSFANIHVHIPAADVFGRTACKVCGVPMLVVPE